MALNENNKVTYQNKVTIITAENLNDIQDSVINLQTMLENGVMPPVDESDNGKFLRVVNGEWAAETVPSAEEASF